MKRIICLLMALVLAASFISACGNTSEKNEDTSSQSTQPLPDYVNGSSPDYNENGELVLTSTSDRLVYPYDGGYVIFSFNGESVASIKRVYEFESSDKAKEYIAQKMAEAANNGAVPEQLAQHGLYVIKTFGFVPNAQPESLESFYTGSKTKVMAYFTELGVETK